MKDFAIVVCSSNQRLDFIPVFQHFLSLNLSSQERSQVYLLGCTKRIEVTGITVLPTSFSEHAPWSQRILEGLREINEENIFFITEDILFLNNESSITLESLYEQFIREKMMMLRIDSFPQPEFSGNRLYGPVSKFSLYRVSLQPSFWQRQYLISLLRESESIWEFELRGSRRSRAENRIFSLRKNFIPYKEVISRGFLSRQGMRLLREAGLKAPSTLQQRGLLSDMLISIRILIIRVIAHSLRSQKKYSGM